jgi:GNAT superfamily N-acetyltransferase
VTFRVEQVKAGVTYPLRQRVLRPHQTIDQMAFPGDDDTDSAHFAALDDGAAVGTGSVQREAPPWPAGEGPTWRLRGMATAEDRRGQGIGAEILAAVFGHVRSHGGGLLWCNARIPAVEFYRRAGLTTRGDSWVEPFIGPHVAMECRVAATPPSPAGRNPGWPGPTGSTAAP